MKILITGVSGFIGKKLFQFLSTKHDIYGVARTQVKHKNCSKLDFLNTDEVVDYFKRNQYDVIINLVSRMASVETAKNIELFSDNIKTQTNLINALHNYKKCYFINFSSSAVYPNVDGVFSENSTIDPTPNSDCLYGLAKYNSEILFKFLFNQNIKLINLRIGYVYGEGMSESRIHKVFEKELIHSNTITLFGNGERIIPQIHINQLIEIVNSFIEKPVDGIFNIADENISFLKIAENMIKLKGNKNSKIILIDKGSTTKFKLNLEKIKNV